MSEEQNEAAAIRRRWITLGEVLAVAAVLISGLTFWNAYSERTSAEEMRAAEKAEQAAAKAEEKVLSRRITLRATVADGGRNLTLAPLDADQAIQSLSIAFPSALDSDGVPAVIEPRIEAGWIRDAARAARRAEGEDRPAGDRRLPIAITTRFVSGGETYADTTLYDLGYRIDSSLLGGTDVELSGLSRIDRVPEAKAQAQLDAIWAGRN